MTHNSGTFDGLFFFFLSFVCRLLAKFVESDVYMALFLPWRRDIRCKYSGNRSVYMVLVWNFILLGLMIRRGHILVLRPRLM